MERIYDLKEVNRIMREDLAKEFPKFKFSVVKDRNTIDLSIVEMPYNPFEDGLPATRVYTYNRHWDRLDHVEGNRVVSKKALEDFKAIAKIANKHNWDNSDPMTDYFDVNFYLNIYIGKPSKYGTDEPLKVISYQRSNNMPNTPNRANKPNNGTAIRSCAGWTIYELSVNGKTVFNARKDKETDKNTADWDAIKGEIFVNTGFKWGRFGAFEKWGGVSLETIDKLCEILSKYYKSSKPDAPQDAKPDNAPDNSVHEFVYGSEEGIPVGFGDEILSRLRKSYNFNVRVLDGAVYILIKGYNLIAVFHYAEKGKFRIGEVNDDLNSGTLTMNSTTINYSQVTPLELAQQIRAWYIEYAEKRGKAPKEDSGKKREYVYGAKDGIPESAGDELIEALRGFGFTVIASSGNLFFMSKPNSQLGLDVVESETDKSITIGSNIYSKDYRLSIPYLGITPYQLARKIENVYNDYLKKTQDAQEDNEAAQKKEKAQKAIAALEIIVNGNFSDEVKERTRKAIAALNLIIKK